MICTICGRTTRTSTATLCNAHYIRLRRHGDALAPMRLERHGHLANGTISRTYRSWSKMKERCLNPSFHQYRDYGGRGITVCDGWLHSFTAFLTDMGERPEERSLDRINPDGNYEPNNCRWATRLEQRHNRRPSAGKIVAAVGR